MESNNQQKPTIPPQPSFFHKALFGEWLGRALLVSLFVFCIVVSSAVLSDQYLQFSLNKIKEKTNPISAFSQFLTNTSEINPIAENLTPPIGGGAIATTTIAQTQTANSTATATIKPTSTNTPTKGVNSPTNTPTNTPQSTNTSSPTPPPATVTPTREPPAECFVIVSGYLYNMQRQVGVLSTDPNTGKTRVHSVVDYTCGTQENPTDMTDTYLEKHSPMGCAERIAPFIVTPPAPTDPTC